MSDTELQLRLLSACIVAGKSAKFTEGAMQRLGLSDHPFNTLRDRIGRNELDTWLRAARTGNYTKLARCFREIVAHTTDYYRTCTAEQLEQIHGIGPKTARFFIIWTRPDAIHAALDVHVLRWLKAQGHKNVPRSTPSGKRYAQLEKTFIAEAQHRGLTPRQLDEQIWKAGSGYVE